MALYEIVIDASLYGQSCINRWNYTSSGSAGDLSGSQALIRAMGLLPTGDPPAYEADTFFQAMRQCQGSDLRYSEVVCKNIYDPTDFWTATFLPNTAGAQGASLSPTIAVGFRTNRVRTDVDRGMKRLAGVPESIQDPGGVLDSSSQATLQDFADFMGANLLYDEGTANITFQPVVVSKERLEPDPPTYPRVRYRYYETLAEQQTHWAIGFVWEFYQQTRTQASRQYKRGS